MFIAVPYNGVDTPISGSEFTDFEIHLDAEEAKDHPKVFTKIHIEFLFRGKDLNSKHIERAIELSQNKYCPITYMLKSSVEINTSYKIEL